MGLLVEGVWRDEWYDTSASDGKFERPATSYRDWIEAGGRFSPETGRYHLYVSWACPWAHRTLIYRKLKGLGTTRPLETHQAFNAATSTSPMSL